MPKRLKYHHALLLSVWIMFVLLTFVLHLDYLVFLINYITTYFYPHLLCSSVLYNSPPLVFDVICSVFVVLVFQLYVYSCVVN